MKYNSKKGFTLVEIMIVVVIIGLLAAMAIPAFQKVRKTSQEKGSDEQPSSIRISCSAVHARPRHELGQLHPDRRD